MNQTGKTVLAVDIGTSSLKGGLIDEAGTLLGWGRVQFDSSPGEEYRHWDAKRWYEAFRKLCRDLGGMEGVDAVTVSGNGPSLVPVDPHGEPVFDSLLWIDGRELRRAGEPSFFLPKAAWLADRHPDIFEKTRLFLGCPEYVACLLTGEAAAFTPSEEFMQYIWTDEGIEAYGFSGEKFPPAVKTGTVMGKVRGEAAGECGIKRGVPVVAGGADFLMALLGTATVRPGRTCDRTGTSEGINCCSMRPVSHPRIRTLPHAVEGYYNAAGILSSTGMIFEWFRRITGQKERDYEEMLEEIRSVPSRPGLPHFFPSLHNGAVWEFAGGAFTGLEAEHGAAEMGRAVVQSIGFGIRDLIETLQGEGCSIDALRVSGGQGRNEVWNQMKADMTGRRVEIPEIIDAELTGGAVAAFSSLEGGDLAETAEGLVRVARVFEPDEKLQERYLQEYEVYERICADMLPVIAEGAGRAEEG